VYPIRDEPLVLVIARLQSQMVGFTCVANDPMNGASVMLCTEDKGTNVDTLMHPPLVLQNLFEDFWFIPIQTPKFEICPPSTVPSHSGLPEVA